MCAYPIIYFANIKNNVQTTDYEITSFVVAVIYYL